ncbi:hypothetical protein ACLUEY_07290 [Vreelandella aquamarina]
MGSPGDIGFIIGSISFYLTFHFYPFSSKRAISTGGNKNIMNPIKSNKTAFLLDVKRCNTSIFLGDISFIAVDMCLINITTSTLD